MNKAKAISTEDYYGNIEKTREAIAKGLYDPACQDLLSMIDFMVKKLRVLREIKSKNIVAPDTILFRTLTKPCQDMLWNNIAFNDKFKKVTNPTEMTVADIANIPLRKIKNFKGMRDCHLRQLKEAVKTAGLKFVK